MAASSSLFRSAGRALRRSIPRRPRPYPPLAGAAPAGEGSRFFFFSTSDRVWAGRRQSGSNSKQAFPTFAPSLAENPRRHFSSDCRAGRMDPNKKLYSMDDLLECKRQIEKNRAVGAFKDAAISEHESKEDQNLKRMKSTFDKLCHCLDEQEHLLQEIEVLMDNDKKFDQVKQFLVAIPSLICIGLILDRMHMFG